MRTPVTAAEEVISSLADVWEMWKLEERLSFWDGVFEVMWDDETASGEYQIEELIKTEALTEWDGEPFPPGFRVAIIQLATGFTACAFAIQAMKAEKGSGVAWAYACEANHWLGICQGIISGRGFEQEGPSKFAQAGAGARHSENRQMKAEVFAWCDANMAAHKSMDGAAVAIAGKEVPVTVRTVRAWMTDWKKNRQSAGTP